jgi:hypothetical protein
VRQQPKRFCAAAEGAAYSLRALDFECDEVVEFGSNGASLDPNGLAPLRRCVRVR